MSKLVFASLVTVSVLALASPAILAGHTGCSDPATLEAGGVYLDVRHLNDDTSLYSVWIFAESGVAAGLQRGGSQVAFEATGQQSTATMIGETDIDCADTLASDILIL